MDDGVAICCLFIESPAPLVRFLCIYLASAKFYFCQLNSIIGNLWCIFDSLDTKPHHAMRTISKKTITDFSNEHAQAKEELSIWFAKAEAAQWANLNQLKEEMPATDLIGNDRYVFNIKGNHYRLIAMIFFGTQRVYIRGIYTHAEYSKLSKKQIMVL